MEFNVRRSVLQELSALTACLQVYENWVKCIMNPFYHVNQPVTSPIFRSRVATAAKKYL